MAGAAVSLSLGQPKQDSAVLPANGVTEQPLTALKDQLPSTVQAKASAAPASSEQMAAPAVVTRPSTANSTTTALPPSPQHLLPLPALLAHLSRQPHSHEALAAAAAALASGQPLTLPLPTGTTNHSPQTAPSQTTSLPASSSPPGTAALPSSPPSQPGSVPHPVSQFAAYPQPYAGALPLPLMLQHASAPTRKMTPNLLNPPNSSSQPTGVKTESGSMAMPKLSPPMCMALAHEAQAANGEDRELASSFLPGTTRTGKRRRRHPVAEVKGNWTYDEDRLLIQLVKEHGPGCWSKLLPHFPGRIGKQLRERWNHELRPDINKQGWQADEEHALVAAHRTAGNCWADIAKVLPGRTQNGVKNHWHATMRKVQRAPQGAAPQSPLQAYLHELRKSKDSNGGSLQSIPSGLERSEPSHSRGAVSPGEGSDRGTEDERDAESDSEQDSDNDGQAKLAMLAAAGLQHQDSGVTPKTPAEMLETPRGYPPQYLDLPESSSRSVSAVSDDDESDEETNQGPEASQRRSLRKRQAPDIDSDTEPRVKRQAGRPASGSSKSMRRVQEAVLKNPEHSVVDTLLLLQGAAEESDGTPPPQTKVRTPRTRRPPAWQRDMTPGTSTPRGNEGLPGSSHQSPVGPAPGPAGLMSVISAAAMAADGMQAMGIKHAGDWEASQLEAALASGGFSELVGHLGNADWPAALGSRWRGPKGSHKRPGYVLLNLLRAVAELPQLWGLQEALRENASTWSAQNANHAGSNNKSRR